MTSHSECISLNGGFITHSQLPSIRKSFGVTPKGPTGSSPRPLAQSAPHPSAQGDGCRRHPSTSIKNFGTILEARFQLLRELYVFSICLNQPSRTKNTFKRDPRWGWIGRAILFCEPIAETACKVLFGVESMLKTSAGCCYERVRMGPHRGRPPSIKKFTCAQFSAIPFALSALTGTIEGNHTICKGLLNEVVPDHDQKVVKMKRFR